MFAMRAETAFNEGRGVSPGDTAYSGAMERQVQKRSMRAGGLAPATPVVAAAGCEPADIVQ